MAIAPVAVEMGPRNRRRLTTGSVSLVAVVAVSLTALWLFGARPFAHSASHSGSAVKPRHLTLIPDNLVYGTTKQQMLHRLGRPEKIAGECWQYPENVKNFVGQTVNAVRLCFISNAYTTWYIELDGKWRNPGNSRIVIAPPTA